MNKKSKKGICVFCGNMRELTKDHIPPKTIFPKPRPNNLITVPSCYECNDSAKKDDEYFGVMMAMQDTNGRHSSSSKLLPKIFDGLRHEKAKGFKQKVFQNFRVQNVVTESGIFLGEHPIFEEEAAPIVRVIERTCKGLFYFEKNKHYPSDYSIKVCFGNSLTDGGIKAQNILVKSAQAAFTAIPKEIGNGEFKYWLRFTYDDENAFVAIFEVFKSHYFLCYSIPKDRL